MSFVFDKEYVELLKKSVLEIGYLQEVLVSSKTGKVLVGRHRKFADSNWPERTVDPLPLMETLATLFQPADDDLAEDLIMLHGDVKRTVSLEETKARLTRIAQKLVNRGVEKEKVCTEMCRLVPYFETYVRRLLPADYKMTAKARIQETATLVSQIPSNVDIGKVRTALEEIAHSGLNGGEPALPFPTCKCGDCANKSLCY
ncbi:hypothetical protein MUP01_10810 [Candidatus Bathyarchaeota archaeon]|nr:hypothetical protein [Candidatus Bathyarchaeota archaeon]